MEVKVVVVGELEENCYILVQDNQCLIVDPGDEYSKIPSNLSSPGHWDGLD